MSSVLQPFGMVVESAFYYGDTVVRPARPVDRAVRVERFTATVDELQTPYVYPQENGNRTAVRWARLSAPDDSGLRIIGHPTVEFSARRWSSEQLDRARHTTDLVAGERVIVILDVAPSRAWAARPAARPGTARRTGGPAVRAVLLATGGTVVLLPV